jgi:hypothetical protein
MVFTHPTLIRSLPLLAALLSLALSSQASAQLKAPRSGAMAPATAPAAPASAAASAPAAKAKSDTEEKENAGRLAAAGWLTVLDRRDWGTAWETSASMFRNAVPLANWMDGIPKVRGEVGALVERTPVASQYKDRLDGRPPGDYVTVIFASKFAQRELEETVTTVREPDGRWRVTGYSAR